MKLEYVVSPVEDFTELTDKFVVDRCCITFGGGMLQIEPLWSDANAAKVADSYIDALRRHMPISRVLTLEQFATLPAQAITSRGSRGGRDLQNRREHLREARREVVSAAHPRLSKCYDYFQSAKERPGYVLVELYKMIETIEEELGGEAKAIKVLGVPQLKNLKRLANDAIDTSRDQRHAPRSPTSGTPLTQGEQAQALEDGGIVLRAFEMWILERG
jgi:hypothetical protein